MAVTIQKKVESKAEAKAAQVSLMETPEFVDGIERMAELAKQIAPLQASLEVLQKEYKGLESSVHDLVEAVTPADQKLALNINGVPVDISAQKEMTEIVDMEAVAKEFEEIEDGLFLRVAKVTLTDMKKYLTGIVYEKLIKKVRKGKRSIKLTVEV
jgi:predicted  nucleic acid-binding Zn-ribbon protein